MSIRARAERIVEGLIEGSDSDYDVLVRTREGRRLHGGLSTNLFSARPGAFACGRPQAKCSLHVTATPDRHPVDRIATIPGDGQSFTTLTIQVIDERNVAQLTERHRDVLYLRTDHGTLRDSQGVNEISSVQLQNGSAAIRLVSGQIKRVATVQILSADPSIRSVDFRVEFT